MEAAAASAGKPDRDGWLRCTIPIESCAHGIGELMRLGADVEIVSPPALRAQMAQALRDTLRCYPRRVARANE